MKHTIKGNQETTPKQKHENLASKQKKPQSDI